MVIRPAAVLVGFALLVLLALRRVLGEAGVASVAATLFFALLGLFPVAFNVRAGHDNWLLSLAFTIAAFALALVLLRFVEGFPGIVICWTVTAVVGWALTSTVLVSTATWPAPAWGGA